MSTVLNGDGTKIDRSRPIVKVNKILTALAANASTLTSTVNLSTRTLPEVTLGDCNNLMRKKLRHVFNISDGIYMST